MPEEFQDMKFKLNQIAVRVVKASVSKRYQTNEHQASQMIANLPAHAHVLREQVLHRGVTISRLYDESLHEYVTANKRLCKIVDLECVLLALAKGAGHLHQHHFGHFDIKPANVLIKWSCIKGYFKGSSVVLADFGLAHKLERGGQYYGTWRGTKKFLCPELDCFKQRGTIQLGDRIDIYAIGATMKEVAGQTNKHKRWFKGFHRLIDDMTNVIPSKRPPAIKLVQLIKTLKTESSFTTFPRFTLSPSRRARAMLDAVTKVDSNILLIGIISHHEGAELKTDTSKRDQSRVIALREEFKSVFTMSIDHGCATFDHRYHLVHAMNRGGAKALIEHLDSNFQTLQLNFICLEYVRMPGEYYQNILFGGLKVAGCPLRDFVITLRNANKLKPECKLLVARAEHAPDRWSSLIQNYESVFGNVRYVEPTKNPLFKAGERTMTHNKQYLVRPYNHREELDRQCKDAKPFAEFTVGTTPDLSKPSQNNETSSGDDDRRDSDSDYVFPDNHNGKIDSISTPNFIESTVVATTPNLTTNNDNDNENNNIDSIDPNGDLGASFLFDLYSIYDDACGKDDTYTPQQPHVVETPQQPHVVTETHARAGPRGN